MEIAYDMYISYFQIMKTVYSLYENRLTLFYFLL